MLLASLGNNVATVALGNHYERCSMILEFVYIRVHTVGCGWSHRATRISLWSLSRSCIEDRMILEVFRNFLTCIKASLKLSVSDIASHDDSTLEVYACANRIFREFCANSLDTLVKVDFNTCSAFAWTTILFWDKFCRIRIHLLEPDTILIDLTLDIAVG